MSGHHDFDHSVHEGNAWLRDIADRLHLEDDHLAYSGLRASLHALRDRLSPESAVHLSAQLPTVVRGLFFEGWKMSRTPTNEHTVEAFAAHVARELPPRFPLDPKSTAMGVFEVIWTKLDPGETAKVIDVLPVPLRGLWPPVARLA